MCICALTCEYIHLDLPAIYRMKPSDQEKELDRMRREQEELEQQIEAEKKRIEEEKAIQKGMHTYINT